jgi:hypothetical protein
VTYSIDAELGRVKLCPKCREWWPADTEFYFPDRARNGLQSWCRACWSEHIQRPEVRAKRLASQRAWYERRKAAQA